MEPNKVICQGRGCRIQLTNNNNNKNNIFSKVYEFYECESCNKLCCINCMYSYCIKCENYISCFWCGKLIDDNVHCKECINKQ